MKNFSSACKLMSHILYIEMLFNLFYYNAGINNRSLAGIHFKLKLVVKLIDLIFHKNC